MTNEIRYITEFLKRAERQIGELPTPIKMKEMTMYSKLLRTTANGQMIKLYVSNPVSGKTYKETIMCCR